MKTLAQQMAVYNAYHRNPKNKATHFIGVPLIIFALMIVLSWPSVAIDGVPVTASTALPSTGSLTSYTWGPSPTLNLTSGKHVLKIVSDQQSFNVNSVNVVSTKKGALLAGTN